MHCIHLVYIIYQKNRARCTIKLARSRSPITKPADNIHHTYLADLTNITHLLLTSPTVLVSTATSDFAAFTKTLYAA